MPRYTHTNKWGWRKAGSLPRRHRTAYNVTYRATGDGYASLAQLSGGQMHIPEVVGKHRKPVEIDADSDSSMPAADGDVACLRSGRRPSAGPVSRYLPK